MTRRAPSHLITPGRSRRIAITMTTIGLALVLGGCAAGGSAGQSQETADAGLRAIPGVSDASVNTRTITSGFTEETSTEIEISVEAGYTVPDPEALVDYLIRVAWSTGTKEADSSVAIDVLTDPQASIVEALDSAGWASAAGTSKHPERALVAADEVKDRLGDWPGDVPELPDGLIVGPADVPAP